MEKRKLAIIEALLCKTNILCDSHLKISSQAIPNSYRNGLQFDETPNDALNNIDNEKEKSSNSNKKNILKESNTCENGDNSKKVKVFFFFNFLINFNIKFILNNLF